MNFYDFYTGKNFSAYKWLGGHLTTKGAVFRVFAPNALRVNIIGDFNDWNETPMSPIYDGNFFEVTIFNAKKGMRYKYRIYEKNGRFLDHCDPFGFYSEPRPQTASVLWQINHYQFSDKAWMVNRTDGKDKPMNIYEIHIGSWKENLNYRDIVRPLISHMKQCGFNYLELMPLCEYPCDASWGYQAFGYFSPTSRYGNPADLMYLIDQCHQNGIGVILDITLVHFAVDDYGLACFDGVPLYEYPHTDIGYNEWGSKNFNHSRGEICSFLQSSVCYWLEEFHFDGVRMDAVRNLIYWQGDENRGEYLPGIHFLQTMNQEIKKLFPTVMLIAEDSSNYPNVTKPVSEGGLEFDYKWDMGWMNDTLTYFKKSPYERLNDYHKLTFSMMYFYHETYILPFSHDENVHGKSTILQKMNGNYDDRFAQARALYLYMYTHPGKKLNFMGNEFGQLREWDEKRSQDWLLLQYPSHNNFFNYICSLGKLYQTNPALWEFDYQKEGFQWIDCKGHQSIYSFLRSGNSDKILAVFNFSDTEIPNYSLTLDQGTKATLILNTEWIEFGGTLSKNHSIHKFEKELEILKLSKFSGRIYRIEE